MDAHHSQVRRFQKRALWILWQREALLLSAGWLFVWGTVVLVSRAAIGVERWPLVIGAAGLVPAVAWALERARRRVPADSAVRALLDRHGEAGGLVMASEEARMDRWADRKLPRVAAPTLRWSRRAMARSGELLAVSGLFVAVGFLLPQRLVEVSRAAPTLDVSSQAGRIEEQVEVLEEERVLEEQQAKELRERVERVKKEASAEDPVRAWESLDHVSESLKQEARKAAEKATEEAENLGQAEALAEAIREDQASSDPAMSPEVAADAMEHLAQMMQRAAAENELAREAMRQQGLDPQSLGELAEQMRKGAEGQNAEGSQQNGRLSQEQLEQLRQAAASAQQAKGMCQGSVGRMAQQRLVSPQQLSQAQQAGQYNNEALRQFLAQQGQRGLSEQSLSQCMAMCQGNGPGSKRSAMGMAGKGGINRGPGPAPMTWQEASESEGAKFEEQVLPQASAAALSQSQRVGVSIGAPEEASPEELSPSRSVRLRDAEAGGGSASEQTVLPRHREAVERYFDRSEEEKQ